MRCFQMFSQVKNIILHFDVEVKVQNCLVGNQQTEFYLHKLKGNNISVLFSCLEERAKLFIYFLYKLFISALVPELFSLEGIERHH